ncbi:transporter substrate-binding domain-containing protein [Undibacterium sp. TS12]|uniref:substrate-binding periplasmic protein n=1 Tax=Undibacterium sp. TS12 TaxID=2908202 RepID=UPI001F4CF563|nr:transporter substrate-binding domain-containing protein [Undibacterium sp. TS12]MCH8621500.1 transporter substrate-binding domain-containing protein [Undibacterium sp. TS12]
MRLQTGGLFTVMALSISLTVPVTAWSREDTRFDIAYPDVNRPSTMAAQKILGTAYAQMGIKVNFIALPAARAMSMWAAGKLDAYSAKIIDSGLPDSVKSSVPIMIEEAVVFATKKNFTVDGYDSLKPYQVGYVSGVTYFEDRLKNVPQKETAPNLESLFRKLDAGRTDVAVDSRFAFCLVRKLGLNQVHMLEPSLERRLGYHFLHSRHQHLLPELDNVLRAMEKDGSIKRIQEEVMQEYMTQCTELSGTKNKKATG